MTRRGFPTWSRRAGIWRRMPRPAAAFLELPNHRVEAGGSSAPLFRLSGTSMSAAVTSGVVAPMIEANRRAHGRVLTPRAIEEILGYTTIPLHGCDELTQGHGGLNAAGAVAVAAAVDAGTPVRRRWTARLPAPRTTIEGEAWKGAETFLFPRCAVWGSGHAIPACAHTIVWGNNTVGDTIVRGNIVDSGDTIVWGNAIAWGHHVGPE